MSDGPDRTGSLHDEAARLLDALGWSVDPHPDGGLPGEVAEPHHRRAEPEAPHAGPTPRVHSPGATAEAAEHPSTCTWCPVCQGVNALRAANPEAVERLADAVILLASALSELAGHVRDRVPPGQRRRSPDPGSAERPSASTSRPSHPGTRPGGPPTAAGGPAAYVIPVTDEE